jgi:hypothetical protein
LDERKAGAWAGEDAVGDDGAPVVWEGTLPALARLTGGEEITFAWDQRDGSGVQVPPGTYFADVVTPLPTVSFTISGHACQEAIPSSGEAIHGQTFRAQVVIGG